MTTICVYNVHIDDEVMEKLRSIIPIGMDEGSWMQHQVQTLFNKLAENARNRNLKPLRLSQRLRGIGHAPKDFDYKKELENM